MFREWGSLCILGGLLRTQYILPGFGVNQRLGLRKWQVRDTVTFAQVNEGSCVEASSLSQLRELRVSDVSQEAAGRLDDSVDIDMDTDKSRLHAWGVRIDLHGVK